MENFIYLCLFIAVVTVAGLCVGIVIYILRILRQVSKLLDDIQTKLNPSLTDVQETVSEIRDITKDINGKLSKTDELFTIMQDLSKNLKLPSALAGQAAESASITAASFLTAVKESAKHFFRHREK